MRESVAVCWVLVVSLTCIAPAQSNDAQSSSSVAGRVVDRLSGRPIADAIVTLAASASVLSVDTFLRRSAAAAHRTARTDGQGHFAFAEVSRGSWTVTVRASGFLTGAADPLGLLGSSIHVEIPGIPGRLPPRSP